MFNKLSTEKSPYLLQHRDNPVEWYPWGDEAFDKAKKENKPIFLSIGYATCHWCHVMAHESFEDKSIASLMNDAFINIKVDREERPDIDSTYMTVCQLLTGQGGWPLTIVMTPDKEPFYAGTYIPKEARFGRIGLRQLIPGIKGMWTHEPERVKKAVAQIKLGFKKSQSFEKGTFPGTEAIDYAAEQLIMRYDEKFGGFGSSPKFPSPHNLMFLLRQWKWTDEKRFLEGVTNTLTAMRLGGIWDHIGFGFHRYSTDREWLLPHFEKMLYDQALMMMVYTEAWQATRNPLFKQTVYEIAEYVSRDLMGSETMFFSAEDADSEGEEGKFYVWETAELESILSSSEIEFFTSLFNLAKQGNFEDEATQLLTGKNIPHLKNELSKEEQQYWEVIRAKLFENRAKRIRPQLDDKLLTDWNALMITAFAKAGAAFQEEQFLSNAESAYQFLRETVFVDDQLYHRHKDGETAIEAFADDYAFLVWAGIELYEATFNTRYLEEALELNKKYSSIFWDTKDGGFFFSVNDKDQPLGRQKQIYDGAIPSANSVSLLNLIKLGRFTGNTSLEEKANTLGQFFSSDLIRSGSSITMSMMGLQFLFHNSKEVIIAEGDAFSKESIALLREKFIPSKVLLFRPKEETDLVYTLADFIKNQPSVDGKTTLYICSDYTCEKPLTHFEKAIEEL